MTGAQAPWLVAYYFHLGLFSAAVAVYLLWAVRWLQRHRWELVLLNGLISLIVAVIVLEFLLNLGNPARAATLFKRNLWDVLWSTSIVILPAMARFLELRREASQDVRAELIQETLSEDDS